MNHRRYMVGLLLALICCIVYGSVLVVCIMLSSTR